jgi:hypothetical protein
MTYTLAGSTTNIVSFFLIGRKDIPCHILIIGMFCLLLILQIAIFTEMRMAKKDSPMNSPSNFNN